MCPDAAGYAATLERICIETIAPEAPNVDHQGAFPQQGLKALAAAGLMGAVSTLWLVPARTPGLRVQGSFDGLGLRGNDSAPVSANGAQVAPSAMLGEDGKGFDIMMGTVLPLFNVLNAACAVGIMEAAVQ